MDKTRIEWCDSTWNPVTGCNYGCKYCYARRIAERFEPHGERVPSELCAEWDIASEKQPGVRILNKPVIGRAKDGTTQTYTYPYGFKPTFHRYRLGDYADKKGRTIFVCSMADLFGAWVPDRWIEEVFAACEKAPQHRYLFLTKNPQRYLELAQAGKLPQKSNMWYGSTITNPDMSAFFGEAYKTFWSIEPILEPFEMEKNKKQLPNWIIVGAETGNRKGKVTPKKEWIDGICKAADITHIAVFMKDSFIPIVGEANMRREFPWDAAEAKEGGKTAAATAAQDTLAPAT